MVHPTDLGYADIGPFGSKLSRTPNLDRIPDGAGTPAIVLGSELAREGFVVRRLVRPPR